MKGLMFVTKLIVSVIILALILIPKVVTLTKTISYGLYGGSWISAEVPWENEKTIKGSGYILGKDKMVVDTSLSGGLFLTFSYNNTVEVGFLSAKPADTNIKPTPSKPFGPFVIPFIKTNDLTLDWISVIMNNNNPLEISGYRLVRKNIAVLNCPQIHLTGEYIDSKFNLECDILAIGNQESAKTTKLSNISVTQESHKFQKRFLQLWNTELSNVDIKSENDTAVISGLVVDSNVKIDLSLFCSLENIRGTGKLALKPQHGGVRKYIINDSGDTLSYLNEQYRCEVLIKNDVDLNVLTFKPQEILFVVDTSLGYISSIKIYRDILEYFKDVPEEKEIYDIAFKKYVNQYQKRYIKDFLEESWNYYGYNTNRIWLFAFAVFVIFFAINILVYPYIQEHIYTVEMFVEPQKKTENYGFLKKVSAEILYSFMYTALLFWVFKIDLSKLRMTNLLIFTLVVSQHIIGIVLIAFMAKAIIQ